MKLAHCAITITPFGTMSMGTRSSPPHPHDIRIMSWHMRFFSMSIVSSSRTGLRENQRLVTNEPVEFKKVGWSSRLEGIYRINLQWINQTRKLSTWNWLVLETLGSWLTMPKNFPGTALEWIGSSHQATVIINSLRTQTLAFQFAKLSLFLRIQIFQFSRLHPPSFYMSDWDKISPNIAQISWWLRQLNYNIEKFEWVKVGTVCMFSNFQTLIEDVKIPQHDESSTCASIGCEFVKDELLFLASYKKHPST